MGTSLKKTEYSTNHHRRLISYLIVVMFFLAIISCGIFDQEDNSSKSLDRIEVKDYSIQTLSEEDMPYNLFTLGTPTTTSDSTDTTGILMFFWDGKKHYHPVQLAQRILLLLNTFRIENDSLFLDESIRFTEKLLEVAIPARSSIYFPYTFDIYPHGGKGINNDILLTVPWFSGMAQGHILSVLVRLYHATNDSKYLETADLVFNSFLDLKSEGDPWVTYIDENDNYWIEEYPMDPPSNVLNGFVFAIYGLYDYYLLDPTDELRTKLLKASLTTIENNILRYRRNGDKSLYCIKHDYSSPGYHDRHVIMLDRLYKMTGEIYFKGVSALFEDDGS